MLGISQVAHVAQMIAKTSATTNSHTIVHVSCLRMEEKHLSGRAGWLRAAVLGADDGVVSVSSLMIEAILCMQKRYAYTSPDTENLVTRLHTPKPALIC
jgi:hypothetical protein